MNTPPFHPIYSPYSSAYNIHSVGSQSSFDRYSSTNGSDRYSDAPLYRAQTLPPKIETRRPEFSKSESFGRRSSAAVGSSASSAMESTAGKDFLFFKYAKRGGRWDDDPIIEEIPASQADLRKKVKEKRRKHSAIAQLANMGSNRRAQIDQHIKILNAEEADGSLWEPVFIENSVVVFKDTTMEVKAFEVVFARNQSNRRTSMGPLPTHLSDHQNVESKAEAKEEKLKKDKKKSKDKKAEKPFMSGAVVDDPFHMTEWFDESGAALGGQGHGSSLPARLPDKPIGTPLPRIIPGLEPDDYPPPPPLPESGPFGAFGVADHGPLKYEVPNRHGLKGDEGIMRVGNDGNMPNYKHESKDRGRRHRHTPSGSPPQSRPRSASRSRNVRFSTDARIILPVSDSASVSSGDIGAIFDEVEELSSRTSEDTHGSPSGRKFYRAFSSANRQHRPGPAQTYSPRRYHFANDEKVLMPERALSKKERAALEQSQAQAHAAYGQEQKIVRRPTSKPIITQTSPPSPMVADEVPPEALYPSHFEEQERRQRVQEQERSADDYMRKTVRERNLQEREAELDKRERDVMNGNYHARKEEERRQREIVELREELETTRLGREFGGRRKVYTHEPRDKYTGFQK